MEQGAGGAEREVLNYVLLGTGKIKNENMGRIVLHLVSSVLTDEISLDIIKYAV